jgi:hypothetical protein
MEEARALETTSKILNYHTENSLKQNYESALFKNISSFITQRQIGIFKFKNRIS